MLEDLICKAQRLDMETARLMANAHKEQLPDLRTNEQGVLWFKNRLCVPKGEAREVLLNEAHNSAYSIHPGTTKMSQNQILVERDEERNNTVCGPM
jgi:hypothetical protein